MSTLERAEIYAGFLIAQQGQDRSIACFEAATLFDYANYLELYIDLMLLF